MYRQTVTLYDSDQVVHDIEHQPSSDRVKGDLQSSSNFLTLDDVPDQSVDQLISHDDGVEVPDVEISLDGFHSHRSLHGDSDDGVYPSQNKRIKLSADQSGIEQCNYGSDRLSDSLDVSEAEGDESVSDLLLQSSDLDSLSLESLIAEGNSDIGSYVDTDSYVDASADVDTSSSLDTGCACCCRSSSDSQTSKEAQHQAYRACDGSRKKDDCRDSEPIHNPVSADQIHCIVALESSTHTYLSDPFNNRANAERDNFSRDWSVSGEDRGLLDLTSDSLDSLSLYSSSMTNVTSQQSSISDQMVPSSFNEDILSRSRSRIRQLNSCTEQVVPQLDIEE